MTPKEKAIELVDYFDNYPLITHWKKSCVLYVVDEIIKALEDYGQNTMELQNMDREFVWWDRVKQEINNLN